MKVRDRLFVVGNLTVFDASECFGEFLHVRGALRIIADWGAAAVKRNLFALGCSTSRLASALADESGRL
jgi:hypothetical protein